MTKKGLIIGGIATIGLLGYFIYNGEKNKYGSVKEYSPEIRAIVKSKTSKPSTRRAIGTMVGGKKRVVGRSKVSPPKKYNLYPKQYAFLEKKRGKKDKSKPEIVDAGESGRGFHKPDAIPFSKKAYSASPFNMQKITSKLEGINIKDLRGAKLKKSLGLKRVMKRWHNHNKSGGNFGINLYQDGGQNYEITGDHNLAGKVTDLHFGHLWQCGVKLFDDSDYREWTYNKLIDFLNSSINKLEQKYGSSPFNMKKIRSALRDDKAKKYGVADKKENFTFWHGTNSNCFKSFNPKKAKKAELHFDPLGKGMYVTDNKEFAKIFGENICEVQIPKNTKIKRYSSNQAFSALMDVFKRAMKKVGVDYWKDLDIGEKLELNRLLEQAKYSPYDAIYDAYAWFCIAYVDKCKKLGFHIEEIATKKFSKYPVVIFKGTHDPTNIHIGSKPTLEIVIYDSKLQKTHKEK